MTDSALWNAAQAAAATGGANTADWHATGVSIDSRTLQPGDLFVALAGPNFDGHDFVAAAFRRGAATAVVRRERASGGEAGGPLLLVDDTLEALRALGVEARRRSAARIVGVTGSVGKTSVKEALARCLAAQAATAASAGSLNNHWGLPLSLARMARACAYGVFELGMNHPGEIRALGAVLRPHVALVTNIAPAHVGLLGSLEAIADAKAEIFETVAGGGAAVLDRDGPFYDHLAAKARAAGVTRIAGFGRDARAEARLIDSTATPEGSTVRAEILGRRLDYEVALPGSHWVVNSLAVLAAAAIAGADPARAAAELAHLAPLKGRGARHRVRLAGGTFELIDDSYNANPASMRAAFEVLGRCRVAHGGRRIAVLGDMLELGPQSAELHCGLAEPLAAAGVDLIFTCGSEMAALDAVLPAPRRGGHAANAAALIPLVTAGVGPADCVLVKGSAGSRMGLVVEALKDMARELPRAANGG